MSGVNYRGRARLRDHQATERLSALLEGVAERAGEPADPDGGVTAGDEVGEHDGPQHRHPVAVRTFFTRPAVIVVIAVAEIPIFGRLVRGAAMQVREMPYVEAATVVGAGRWWVLRRHVLPNAAEPAGVQVAVSLSVAVFVERAMNFLGIGVRPPDPSLGSIIAGSVLYLDVNPGMALGPLVVVTLLVLGFLLVAQALAAGRRVAG